MTVSKLKLELRFIQCDDVYSMHYSHFLLLNVARQICYSIKVLIFVASCTIFVYFLCIVGGLMAGVTILPVVTPSL